MCRWYCESGRVGSRHFRMSGCDCSSDRTRSFFVPCCELSASSAHKGGSTPASSPAAHHPPHRPTSPAEAKPSGQPYATKPPVKHTPRIPRRQSLWPAVQVLLRAEPTFSCCSKLRSGSKAPVCRSCCTSPKLPAKHAPLILPTTKPVAQH